MVTERSALEQREEKGRIEAAIEDVVVDAGYVNATLEAVCEQAGVTEEDFHRHFEGLEDGYCQMLEGEREEFLRRAGEAFAAETGWRNQIRASAYAIRDYLGEDDRRARFVFLEVLTASERALLIRDQGMQLLYALIDLGRNELDDPDSVTRAVAEGIGGSVYNQLQLAIASDQISDDLVRQLLYVVVLPYLGEDIAHEELRIPRPRSAGGDGGRQWAVPGSNQ